MPDDAQDRARFLRQIEATFVALQGKGFMLAATDVQRLDDWRSRGAPARLVLDAVRDGIQRFRKTHAPGTALPRSLSYFAPAIEARIAAWRDRTMAWLPDAEAPAPPGRSAGGGEGPRSRLFDALDRARQGAGDPRLAALLERVSAEAEASESDPWALAAELDRALADGALGLLDAQERDGLRRRAEEAVAKRGSRAMSGEARRERTGVEVARLVRERFGLPELLEVLLGQ